MAHDIPVRVEHVGIAVESIAAAEPFLTALGAERYVVDDDPAGEVRWAGYLLGTASRLELVTPLDEDSFLQEYLDANGPGLHHVTLEVADVDAVADALEADGYRVVDRAHHPEVGYSEAFVSPHNPTGALFQLMAFHEGYAADHGGADAFVGGHRVGNADAVRDGEGDDVGREVGE